MKAILYTLWSLPVASGFTLHPSTSSRLVKWRKANASRQFALRTEQLSSSQSDTVARESVKNFGWSKPTRDILSGLAITGMLAGGSVPAVAYNPGDYASDAVVTAVQSLKDSSGNVEQTFKTYESIASIITEGRGVGGIINYKGVQLDRGYIADEDTSIYNPGLTLLTESEKERLVEAVIQSRKENVNQNQWSDQNQLAYEFLRDKLDPLHTTELRGYLAIFPFYTAAVYLATLAIQQLARNVFPIAYFVGVTAIVAPIIILISAGP